MKYRLEKSRIWFDDVRLTNTEIVHALNSMHAKIKGQEKERAKNDHNKTKR